MVALLRPGALRTRSRTEHAIRAGLQNRHLVVEPKEISESLNYKKNICLISLYRVISQSSVPISRSSYLITDEDDSERKSRRDVQKTIKV